MLVLKRDFFLKKKIKFKIIDSKKMDSFIFNKNKKYLLLDFENCNFHLL